MYLLLLLLRVACSSKRAPVRMPRMQFTGSVYWHLLAHHVNMQLSSIQKKKIILEYFCLTHMQPPPRDRKYTLGRAHQPAVMEWTLTLMLHLKAWLLSWWGGGVPISRLLTCDIRAGVIFYGNLATAQARALKHPTS